TRRNRGRRRRGRRALHRGAARRALPARCILEVPIMSDTESKLPLPDLEKNAGVVMDAPASADAEPTTRSADDLEAVFDVPVKVSAVARRARMEVGDLLKLAPGAPVEIDRKGAPAHDISVTNRIEPPAEAGL